MAGNSAGFTKQWDFPTLQGEDVYAATMITQLVKPEGYFVTDATET